MFTSLMFLPVLAAGLRQINRCCVVLFLLMFLILAPSLQAQSVNETKTGKGLQFVSQDSLFSAKINMRMQLLFASSYDLDRKQHQNQAEVRRARLKFEGFAYRPELVYKLELAFSNADLDGLSDANSTTPNIVLDAHVKWSPTPSLDLLFGQTKLPGNREQLVSSQKMQFVNRSLLNSTYSLDRDFGVQLHHQFTLGNVVFREMGSLSMGEGRNITTDNRGGYDLTGRVEVLPLGAFYGQGDYVGGDLAREETPKLALALAFDYNHDASRQRGQQGEYLSQTRHLQTFFADAMFKYQGFSAMAEYANRQTPGSPVVAYEPGTQKVAETFFTGTGFNVQAGYLFQNNMEVAARYTSINPENLTQRQDQKLYTLGLSKYIMGHTLKAQSDLTFVRQQHAGDNLLYRFQLEVGF